ncbi:hypothetical protein ABIE78_003204 [Sinorhizobium fredii]|uniref:hypothetical protein n=1 Tax=Rhizobium fredii TaxID=380 RepID=UPI00059C5F1D|nr:hypothetical protein [Sinorhizobium fredii]
MRRENVAFILKVAGTVIALFIMGLCRPDLLVEDHLVESLGALAFAAASLLALGTAIRNCAVFSAYERNVLVGTSGLCIILFLSEISFGARILGLKMPQMRGGGEFDGGHDIAIVAFRLMRDTGLAGYLIAATASLLLLVSAAVLLYSYRQQAGTILVQILTSVFECRIVFAMAMLASAVTLDLLTSYKAAVLEEVLEFAASGVFVLAIIAFRRETSSKRKSPCRAVYGKA